MVRRASIVSGLLIAGALYLAAASKSEPATVRRSLSELPARIGTWEGERATEFDQDTLAVLGVDDYINRVYLHPSRAAVGLYIGFYRSQRQGDTIHSPMNCLPGAGWIPVEKDVLAVPVQSGASSRSDPDPRSGAIRINRIVIQKGLDKQLVLYWYQSHGRVLASEYWGKIYTVIDAIRTNRTDAALVRVISPVKGLEEVAEGEAEKEAIDFVESLFPLLGQYLPN